MDTKLPLELGNVYYKESQDETKGSKGITIFIPILSNVNNIKLDSVIFRGKETSLKLENNEFVGQFEAVENLKKDFIMSNKPYAEYGNKAPILPFKSSLELSNSEAIISYTEGSKTKFFKVSNIIQK
jgi:hypothetical protein